MANRRSQNFCAEQILKTLGAARFGKGSFETGVGRGAGIHAARRICRTRP